MSVYSKLLSVQSKLVAPKGQYNKFGKYNFRSCEDILEAAKPILFDEKCTIFLSDKMVLIGERYYLEAKATFIDTETGELIEVTSLGREELSQKGMNTAQITGSTSSYARKYALNGLLCIDDNKDPDHTNKHETKPEKPKVKTLQQLQSEVKSLETDLGMTKEQKIAERGNYLEDPTKIDSFEFYHKILTNRVATKKLEEGDK